MGIGDAGRWAPGASTGLGRPAGQAPGTDLEALICGVARGDRGAFEAVCARAGPTVFGVVRAVVRDPFQAEEVCQEVLLEVWCAAPTFEPGRGSAMAWVTTIAHRRAIDRIRSERRLAEREMRAASHEVSYDEVAEAVEARLDRNAPGAVLLTARVRAGGTVTVVMSHRDRSLVFTTAGLPSLPAGRCYQLWLMGPAGDRPVSVLPAPDQGMTSPVIATGLTAGDWIGLTAGPASMSRHPASTPILMLNLTT